MASSLKVGIISCKPQGFLSALSSELPWAEASSDQLWVSRVCVCVCAQNCVHMWGGGCEGSTETLGDAACHAQLASWL